MRKFKITKIVLCSIMLTVLAACQSSNDLTRDRAAKLIVDRSGFPVTETISVRTKLNVSRREIGGTWKALQDQGYVRVDITQDESHRRHNMYLMELTFTDSGKKYVGSNNASGDSAKIITSYRVFREVTGISMNAEKTTAQVEFTWEYDDLTPFGEAFSKDKSFRDARYLQNIKPEKAVALFKLYDDGWRISAIGRL